MNMHQSYTLCNIITDMYNDTFNTIPLLPVNEEVKNMSEYVMYVRASRLDACPECESSEFSVNRYDAHCPDCGFAHGF